MDCWDTLGLSETTNIDLIQAHYTQKASLLDPENDKEELTALSKACNVACSVAEHNKPERKRRARSRSIIAIILFTLLLTRYLLTHVNQPTSHTSSGLSVVSPPTMVIDPNSSVFQKVTSSDLAAVQPIIYYSATILDYIMLPIVTNDNGTTQGPVVDTHVLKDGDKNYNGYALLGRIDSTNIILVVDIKEYIKLTTAKDESITVAGKFYETTPAMTEQIDSFLKQIGSHSTYYKAKYLKVLY